MSISPRRRPFAGLLVCVAIATATTGQFAHAAPPEAEQNNGQQNHGPQHAPGQAAKDAASAPPAAVPAPPAQPTPPEAAASEQPSPGKSEHASPGNGGPPEAAKATPPGQAAKADPPGQANGNGNGHAKKDPPTPHGPEAAARPEQGRSNHGHGTPEAAHRSETSTVSDGQGASNADPGKGKSATAKAEEQQRSGAGTGSSAPGATTAAAGTTAAAPANESAAAGQSAPEAATLEQQAAAAAAAAATARAAARNAASSQRLRNAARAAEERRRRVFFELRNQLLGVDSAVTSASGVLPTTPPAAGLSGGELGVREAGSASVARLDPPSAELEGSTSVSSIVRDVVGRVPRWLWILLGILSTLVLALGAQTFLAAARTRRLEHQRAQLMVDVGVLQEALLPAVPADMGGLTTSVAYRPADGLAAGGDFYDAFALPDGRSGMLLGDVSGHGREALAKTALVRFTVRAHLEAGLSPREAISIAGRSLDGRLADDFATVIVAVHDPSRGTLTYSSAGHPPPLVAGPPAHLPLTASSAPPLDVGFPTGQRQTVLPMPAGTTVALYSDGLIEARIDGEAIGPERLTAWLADLGRAATAKQLVDLVVQRGDRVPDDLAAIVLHAEQGATAPSVRVEQLKLDVLDSDGPDLDIFLRAAGVERAERRLVGRRVSEELAVTGGVIVSVRATEPPEVDVSPIGGRSSSASRTHARAR